MLENEPKPYQIAIIRLPFTIRRSVCESEQNEKKTQAKYSELMQIANSK